MASWFPVPPSGPLAVRVRPGGSRGRPRPAALDSIELWEADDLQAPPAAVLAGLLHRAVHLVNARRGVSDCSPAGYHNRHFRRLADAVGLCVDRRAAGTGWAATRPSPALVAHLGRLARPEMSLAAAGGDGRQPSRLLPSRCYLPGPRAGAVPDRHHGPLLPLCRVPRYRVVLERGEVASRLYPRLLETEDFAALFVQILCPCDSEALAALYLDSRCRLIFWDVPYRGTLEGARVEPRRILTAALLANAAAVAVAHNHPSCDLVLHAPDREFHRRLAVATAGVGLVLADAFLVAPDGRWRSLRGGASSWAEALGSGGSGDPRPAHGRGARHDG
jgi:hypothetical protein